LAEIHLAEWKLLGYKGNMSKSVNRCRDIDREITTEREWETRNL